MNPNMRVLWENVADRGDIAASSEAGTLIASNLRSNFKSKVWRSMSVNEGLVVNWEDPETVAMVALAFNNLTAQATMRVRGYTYPGNLIPEFDIGPVDAAPAPGLGQFPIGLMPLGTNFYQRGGASMFAYGYGSYGVVYVPGFRSVRKLEILISDPNNPDGYIEVGRLIAGSYWEPLHNFSFSHSIKFPELTNQVRSQAGDLRGERMPMWKAIEFSLQYMDPEDLAAMLQLSRRHGLHRPLFVSLFPENENPILEQAYQLWGKFSQSGAMSNPNYDIYATQVSIEES